MITRPGFHPTTKQATSVSTSALAAFLTWKQADLLLLMEAAQQDGVPLSCSGYTDYMIDIWDYDRSNGGAFYKKPHYSATHSTLRTLERRRLCERQLARNGLIVWSATKRGIKAIRALELII
jgi:hypothetical protein